MNDRQILFTLLALDRNIGINFYNLYKIDEYKDT